MNLLETAERLGIQGFMHPAELEKLAELAVGKQVLEIGSFKGLSAFCMAIGADRLWCVDTFRANSAGQFQEEHLTTLDVFRRNTARFCNVQDRVGTSEWAASKIFDTFDLIFLDASHTYEDVRDDIERWWPKLRAGGVMAFHDYGHDDFPGVKQAVDERFGDLGPYDPENQPWIVTLRWVEKA